jgi:thiamine-monophosphate kinase
VGVTTAPYGVKERSQTDDAGAGPSAGRAYGVNASDIAAMGGRPRFAVMALEVPSGTSARTLDGIVAGFVAAARRHVASLVGGNVTRGPALAITVTLFGTAGARIVTRAGASPGDRVVVTGRFGAMGAAVRDRRAGRRTPLPAVPYRVRAGRALADVATAMIDVSDGLVQDLGHLARASGVAIRVDATRLPLARSLGGAGRRAIELALTAGEDYELACTVPSRHVARLAGLAARVGVSITPIGVVEHGRPAVRVVDDRGRPFAVRRGGFDHLADRARRR